MSALASKSRRKCFNSYHHVDEAQAEQFVQTFDHDGDLLIARGMGASLSVDTIDGGNGEFITSMIREKYLRDTTVTIVLVGKENWGSKFVDWEIGPSLRNNATASASGLLAITLPSAASYVGNQLPARVDDNVTGEDGYARWWKYPTTTEGLSNNIEIAYSARTVKSDLRSNIRPLRMRNA